MPLSGSVSEIPDQITPDRVPDSLPAKIIYDLSANSEIRRTTILDEFGLVVQKILTPSLVVIVSSNDDVCFFAIDVVLRYVHSTELVPLGGSPRLETGREVETNPLPFRSGRVP